MIELEQIANEAGAAIAAATDLSALDDLRVDYLGKKGRLTGLLKDLGALSNEERPAAGAKINDCELSSACTAADRDRGARAYGNSSWIFSSKRDWLCDVRVERFITAT